MDKDVPIYGDVMLDIETLGIDSSAVVVSIGAVRFRLDGSDDPITLQEDGRSFYAVLDTEEQQARGRTVDPDTLAWWAEQSEDARAVLTAECEDTHSAIARFISFCAGVRRIWGNGNMFDNAIIRSLCKDYGQEYPVDFRGDLDQRTLRYLWNKLMNWKSKIDVRVGVGHNALDDAKSQVLTVQQMYRECKGSKYDGA